MRKITSRLIEEKYLIQTGNSKFVVSVDQQNGRFRLDNSHGQKHFIFQGSKPETAELIADVLKYAAKLVKPKEEVEMVLTINGKRLMNTPKHLQKNAKGVKSK